MKIVFKAKRDSSKALAYCFNLNLIFCSINYLNYLAIFFSSVYSSDDKYTAINPIFLLFLVLLSFESSISITKSLTFLKIGFRCRNEDQ